MIIPTIGRIVHYKLNEGDVNTIRAYRETSGNRLYGNQVSAGQVYPAIITRVWGDTESSCVQLQVFLDGNDILHGSSRQCGDAEGQFQWMPYQLGQAAKTEEAQQALIAATEQSA